MLFSSQSEILCLRVTFGFADMFLKGEVVERERAIEQLGWNQSAPLQTCKRKYLNTYKHI